MKEEAEEAEEAAAAEGGRMGWWVREGGHWPSLQAYKSESRDDCKRQERQEKVSERTMTTMTRDGERLNRTKKKKACGPEQKVKHFVRRKGHEDGEIRK